MKTIRIDIIQQFIYLNYPIQKAIILKGKIMKITYKTEGTCSRSIDIEIDETEIKAVSFAGGCKGNTYGLSALLAGRSIHEVIPKLKGIVCRGNTSCPDQLANALEEMLMEKAS